MDFEKDIFKRAYPDYQKLLEYGFIKEKDTYFFKTIIMSNFELIVSINDTITSKIIDLDFNEEYINYRLENQAGEFVSKVRNEYLKVLSDIKNQCFVNKPFMTEQANRISNLILKKYGDVPIFKWDNLDAGVFENNNKWYGIIMNVDRSKITDGGGEVEVLNIKLDRNKVLNLLKEKGFYKAYHMNKKSWISIILDDTLDDNKIFELIEESYSYTIEVLKSKNEWVMPINPSYFDVFNYFDNADIYYWDKKKRFNKEDIIYLYITKPIGAIMYKCVVDDFNEDFMIVKKICKYDKNKYTLDVLKKYGLTSLRSTRHIPEKLSFKMRSDENEY